MRIIAQTAIFLLVLISPSLAEAKDYKGTWEGGNTITLTVSGDSTKYCTHNEGCTPTKKIKDPANFFFNKGNRGSKGAWGVRITKDGACYKLLFSGFEMKKQKAKVC